MHADISIQKQQNGLCSGANIRYISVTYPFRVSINSTLYKQWSKCTFKCMEVLQWIKGITFSTEFNFAIKSLKNSQGTPFSQYGYQFSMRNTKIYKIYQLHMLIFFTFCNISKPNFAILLTFGCSLTLFLWIAQFRDFFQNFAQCAIGPFAKGKFFIHAFWTV